MGTLTVAGLIEKLSGLKIRDYLKKAIFQPLKLGSIGLGSIGFDRRRLIRVETPAYQANSDFGWNGRYWQELGAPWGGMFSSIEDFSVICQLMLNEGTYGKTRILAPQTVKMMTTNRLNDYPQLPEETRRTQPWGLGWRMNHVGTSSSWGDTLDRSVFGHTGATGTMAWMDRNRDGFCLIFTTGIRSKAPWRLVRVSNAISSAFL